jgi:hypothetical protein
MPETVKVSLVQPRRFRMSKGDEFTIYKSGVQEMPVEHARAMGLLHRVVREEKGTVVRDAFGGTFDERLTRQLNEAGYTDLEQLRTLSDDELLSIQGVGPAAFERIKGALRGGD